MGKINYWISQFVDKAEERAYREYFLHSDAKQTIIVALIFILPGLVFFNTEKTLLGIETHLFGTVTVRALFIPLSILLIAFLWRVKNALYSDLAMFSFTLSLSLFVTLAHLFRTDSQVATILANFIVLLILYALPNMRWTFTIAPPLLFTASHVVILAVKEPEIFHTPLGRAALVGYFMLNALGLFKGWQAKVLRREQYLLRKKAEELNHQLEKAATTDPLTGCPNRRKGTDFMAQEWSRYERYQRPFCFANIDLDFFKKVNDTYSHIAGDKVLKAFAELVQSSIRDQDMLCRLGGEEFAIIFPETQLADAINIAERVRRLCEQTAVEFNNQTIRFTVSMGLTECNTQDKSLDDVYMRTDALLYQAKHNGRNRVEHQLA